MASAGHFVSTRWSLIARAASPGAPGTREALEELCGAYWWPLYAYLRKNGRNGHDAADLVQGFFADLLEKGRFAHADPQRGRFRCWLLQALKFHLSHERERRDAVKRGGRARFVSIDEPAADRRWKAIAHQDPDPERLFDRAWAVALLEQALLALEKEYALEGKARLFAALRPGLLGAPEALDQRTVALSLGTTVPAVKAAAFKLRKAFGTAIRAEIAATLDSVAEVEQELGVLFSALASPESEKP